MPPPTGAGPTVANRFSVKIDGIEMFFSELTGIHSEVEKVDFYTNSPGGQNTIVKLHGKYIPPTITLKRGTDNNLTLWSWHQALIDGNTKDMSKGGSFYIYSSSGTDPVAIFNFEDAWCRKMTLGAARAGAGDVLIEDCEIMCTALFRVK
jgi:phage tail-like protein